MADAYASAGLGDIVSLPAPRDGEDPANHMFVVRAEDADGIARRLSEAGIASRSYYRDPVHRQPSMAAWKPASELPGTTLASRSNLALPMGPTLGTDTAVTVAEALRAA